MRIAVLLLLTAATVSAVSCQELRSQQPRRVASREAPSQTDSIGGLFRAALAAVAEASELPRLDSTTLLGGVRREIRIYYVGMGQPYKVVRLVQHTHGVDGQFGLFWPAATWLRGYLSPEEERRTREQNRAFDATVRAWADTAYDCRAIQQSRAMNVCWLAPRAGRVVWAQLLARLDSLGIDTLPMQRRTGGVDGWMSLVEVRKPLGYRSYFYWMPDSTSADAGERASARISTTVFGSLHAPCREVGRVDNPPESVSHIYSRARNGRPFLDSANRTPGGAS